MMVAIAGDSGVRRHKAPLTVEIRMEPFIPPRAFEGPQNHSNTVLETELERIKCVHESTAISVHHLPSSGTILERGSRTLKSADTLNDPGRIPSIVGYKSLKNPSVSIAYTWFSHPGSSTSVLVRLQGSEKIT